MDSTKIQCVFNRDETRKIHSLRIVKKKLIVYNVKWKKERNVEMSRKSTFEDFEELTEHTEIQADADAASSEVQASSAPGGADNGGKGPSTEKTSLEFTPISSGRMRGIDADAFDEEAEPSYDTDVPVYTGRKRRKKRSKAGFAAGIILVIVQILCSGLLIWNLSVLNMLPDKYFWPIVLILVLLAGICLAAQWIRRVHIVGKILSGLLCALLIVLSIYIGKTHGLLSSITSGKMYQTDKIVVAVLAEDEADSILDTATYTFGIAKTLDREKVDLAISQINDAIGIQIKTEEYASYTDQVNALYDGEVEAIIYNRAMNELIEENNPGFTDKVRILDNFDVQTEVFMEDIPDLPITEEPFALFLSGMDVYGDIEETGRSDVNILACVNPTTKQVLLISVPRDAYVEIPGITYYGERDKLTHAGMYGVQYSMNALEEIFGVDVNYYARVNFSSLIMMVDALGGIDVDSDYAFSTYYKQYTQATDTWEYYTYKKGENHLNGDYALAFARERMNLPGGDYQRGKNQQKVIEGLLEKLKSPAVLLNYTQLLDSLSGKMDTSLSSTQIASLVKMQLNDGAEWNIISASVYGTSSYEYCASYSGSPLAVEILDEDSIAAVKEVIDDLFAGRVISEPRTTYLEEIYDVDDSELDSEYYMNNHAEEWEYSGSYFTKGKNGGSSSGYYDEEIYEDPYGSEDGYGYGDDLSGYDDGGYDDDDAGLYTDDPYAEYDDTDGYDDTGSDMYSDTDDAGMDAVYE